ncbi:MAG: hypothetical protein JSW66_20565 [Phycisphaerales bacterium]|nr:MAG: hypothetical protein JSW66_20565 [Phycisphaerales bacterium]
MKHKWKTLSIAYIILIIVLTVLATGGSILTHRFEYIAGTRNDVDYSMLYGFGLSVILFLFILLPIATSASILALVSLVLRHGNVGQVLLKLALILLGPVIVCCAFLYTVPLSPIFLKGFEQWVLQETDIDAIQTWLASEGAKHAGQLYSLHSKEGLPAELPECLLELNPAFISFRDSDSHNGQRVEMGWFHFMDEHGLIVGSPAMETPEEGHVKLDSSNYEFRRPVKRGAYVFIRG